MRFPAELPDRRTNPPEPQEVTRKQLIDHEYGYCRPDCPLCAEEREQAEEEHAHRGRIGFCAKCNGECLFDSDGNRRVD